MLLRFFSQRDLRNMSGTKLISNQLTILAANPNIITLGQCHWFTVNVYKIAGPNNLKWICKFLHSSRSQMLRLSHNYQNLHIYEDKENQFHFFLAYIFLCEMCSKLLICELCYFNSHIVVTVVSICYHNVINCWLKSCVWEA